jgi:hypothetical protein
MVTLVAPVVAQDRVILVPGPATVGLAEKEVITGGFAGSAVAVVVAVADPNELVAVSVYRVVAFRTTLTDVPVTGPTTGLMIMPGAPVTVQLSVMVPPAVTFDGVAVNPLMVGRVPAITDTEDVADPKALVAVSV